MRASEFKITKVKHHGVEKLQVNFGLHNGGKRRFRTEAEAKAAIKKFKAERQKLGELAGKLSATEIAQVLEAKRIIEGTGINLADAAYLAKDQVEKALASETFGRAFDEYYAYCKKEYAKKVRESPRKEPKYVWAVGQTRKLFADLSETLLTDVTSEQLEEKLDRNKPSQFNKHVAHLKAVFNYAKGKKWVQENPVLEIKKESTHSREARAYKPDQVRRFMDTLVETDRKSIPYYALIFFAGLRPDTAFKLDWSALNSGTQIQIRRTVSKTSRAFPVTITPTLQAWINWWEKQGGRREGPIHPMSDKTRTRNRKKLCLRSGLAWIQDAPRRTFGTAHYLTYNNAAHAAAELGHTKGADVFYQHYFDGELTPEEAKAFWDIKPPADFA